MTDRSPCPDVIPLSFAQQAMWQEVQWYPEPGAHHITIAVRLRGNLDVKRLERCVNDMIERQGILRGVFVLDAGTPAQRLVARLPDRLPVVTLEDVSADERGRALERLARREARKPFDLFEGPLVRATLFRLSRREHVVLLVVHHLVADGWSKQLILKELGTRYAATAASPPRPVAAPRVSYPDFVLQQRARLRGRRLDRLLAFWTAHCRPDPARARGASETPAPAALVRQDRHVFDLSTDAMQALQLVCRREGATPFMVLLWAIKMLIRRHTGHRHVVVAVAHANRARPDTQGTVGLFVDTLLLCSTLGPDLGASESLQHVRETTVEAYRHHELPFMMLLRALKPTLPTNGPLRCDAFVNMRWWPRYTATVNGLYIEELSLVREEVVSPLDLNVVITAVGGRVRVSLFYGSRRFDRTCIRDMETQMHEVLLWLAAKPDARLGPQ